MLKRNIYIKPIATPIDLEDVVEGCLLAGSGQIEGGGMPGVGGNGPEPPGEGQFGAKQGGFMFCDDYDEDIDEY